MTGCTCLGADVAQINRVQDRMSAPDTWAADQIAARTVLSDFTLALVDLHARQRALTEAPQEPDGAPHV